MSGNPWALGKHPTLGTGGLIFPKEYSSTVFHGKTSPLYKRECPYK